MNQENNTIYPLKPQEEDLIRLIRNKYRFGSIEVVTKDGLPIDILKTVERTRLDCG